MKRDLKLNMGHLSDTLDSIQGYLDRVNRLEAACTTFLSVLKKQDSVSYQTLSEEWEEDVIGYIGEIGERLGLVKTMLSGYIADMKAYVAPESESVMMRVDRNDIWWNITQIESGVTKVFDFMWDTGSSFPDYKHFRLDWWSEETRAIRAQEEAEQRRRERNYDKLANFRTVSVNAAYEVFCDEVSAIWDIYNQAIVPFENTDDDYACQARFYYDTWGTFLNKLEDLGEGIKDFGRGLWDATVDLLDGVFSLALFLLYESTPGARFIPLPAPLEARVTGMEAGIEAIVTDPMGVIEAMGQSMTDTYEEEGMAYAVGYISLDIIVEVVATKGLGSAKGAAKAADTASDAAGAVKNVEKLADAADTASDAARTADRAADAAEAVKQVDKATDAVTDAAEAAKKADIATDAAGVKTKLDYITSNGLELEATPGKTTTVLGTYNKDTGAILDELGNVKSLDFGPRDGGFNLLNTPDELYVTPDQFWNEYNKPWLDNVIARDDIIKIATEPTWDNLTRINKITGKTELTGFGREYNYLRQHGYKYDPITKTMSK